MSPPRLALSGITKAYGSVVASNDVSLTILPGEIHGLLGENGAGKSTLMKVIYGSVRPDKGEVRWNGQPVSIASPRAARALGVSMVFQHFSLFESLTVAENVLLGLPTDMTLPKVNARLKTLATEYGIELDPNRPLHSLSVGERQRVEIARALMTDPKLLILDEPTSVLTPQAVQRLFVTLRQLSSEGTSIVYISHKLDEVRALCSRCTVLRGGRVTGTDIDPTKHDNAGLARLMVGEEPQALTRTPNKTAQEKPAALEVRGLSLASADPYGTTLKEIALSVHPGEIVGIAGVSGNGQQELVAALSGEDPRTNGETVKLFGKAIGGVSPHVRRMQGMRVVPEERLGRGAVPPLALAKNTLLTRGECLGRFGLIRNKDLVENTTGLISRFRVKADGPGAAARSLSGGNLQKFIVGRELEAKPMVMIASQPTWGVDVGAAAQIRAGLLALRDAGCAVLVISEELEELFELSDRLFVIAGGKLSPSLPIEDATVAQVGVWMSGAWPGAAEVAHG
ncbi:MAG TPA: ABC transporter ATP-binding protein [Polyangiales bacterium]|nr:ABC transporter ATP-binding protein [Polyangiales bacterium]